MAASAPKGQAAFSIGINVSQTDLNRVVKRLDKMQGQPLEVRIKKALGGAASLMVGPLRANAPVSDHGHTGRYAHPSGNLRSHIRARQLRKRSGEVAAAYAGTSTYYGLWVQQGKGPGTRTPNEFVQRTQSQMEPALNKFIDDQVSRLE